MKSKLENAVRQGHLGSRSRSTKKMNTATTPDHRPPELNGNIIQNFIHHLSTTKANIESTIPNPNQFYTTPSAYDGTIEPLMIMGSNTFFPSSEMNLNSGDMKNGQHTEQGLPIVMAVHTNQVPGQNVTTSTAAVNQPPSQQPVPLEISQTPMQTSSNQNVRVPSRKPIRRRPQSQHIKHQSTSAFHSSTTNPSQTVQPQGTVPQYSQYQSLQPQHQSPTDENSLNIYHGIASQQQAEPLLLPSSTSSFNSHNPEMGDYPINSAANQQKLQLMNAISPLQTLTGQQIGHNNQTLQPTLPMSQDAVVNRPNNSLKQLQLQFLLDCSLLDPNTKTRIPLGTNPVGDDFFFTPMPYTNQNPQYAPVNVKQVHFHPFHPQTYLPSFPSLFSTTPAPITTVVLTDTTTTQATQQPIYVSVQPAQPAQHSHKRKNKKKVKNVYVDLPIVSEVGNMLDKVYNFMEESLVTKVVKKTENQPARRVQSTHTHHTSHHPSHTQVVQVIPGIQIVNDAGSSEEDYSQRYTTPYYRTTRSRKHRPKKRRPVAGTYLINRLPTNDWQPITFHRQKRTTLVPGNTVKTDNRNKNFLTTKIHVTSEYIGPANPTESIEDVNKKKVTKAGENDDDDYEDYEDSFPYLSFDSGTDDDDDEDDDDDDKDSNSAQTNEDSASVQVTRINTKKQKEVKKKTRKNSKETSLESESDEDDDNDGGSNYMPSMGMFGDFFGNMVSSVNKYVPSMGKMPSISGYIPSIGTYFRGGTGSKELDSNNIDREERSTTPQIETRNPKNPKHIFSDYNDYNGIDGLDGNEVDSGNYPFFGSNEVTTAAPVTEASNDYWNWFGNSNENVVESSTDSTATNQNSSGNCSSEENSLESHNRPQSDILLKSLNSVIETFQMSHFHFSLLGSSYRSFQSVSHEVIRTI